MGEKYGLTPQEVSMALLDILKFPDPRLRKMSVEVESVTPEIVQFAKDMIETMYSAQGIGLSAPQVNRLIRLLVADTRPHPEEPHPEEPRPVEPQPLEPPPAKDNKDDLNEAELTEARYDFAQMTELEQKVEQPFVIINPVITLREGATTFKEGCLSVPSYFETVKRYNLIEVEGLNLKGEKFVTRTDGLLAICIQHEIDHLDGKLFIDRLSPIKANRIKSKIKKFGYPKGSEKEPDDTTDGEEDGTPGSQVSP